MTQRELYDALTARFPLKCAAPYDFDGLQICPDETRPVRRVVCALDLTSDSVQKAKESGADLLITHHPIFFGGIRTLDPAFSHDTKNATALLAAGIAHISLHTRFDAGDGGINDTLAAKLRLTDVEGFGTDDEIRKLGRIGNTAPVSSREFAAFCARTLGTHVLLTDAGNTVRRVAAVGGSAGDYLDLFLLSDADALVTGEVSHHHRIAANEAGKTLIEAGHYGSEIVFCEAITKVLLSLEDAPEIIPMTDTCHEVCILDDECV